MNGDTQTVGALTVQTWCALAENSEDYSLLSLRTQINGDDTLVVRGVGGTTSESQTGIEKNCTSSGIISTSRII